MITSDGKCGGLTGEGKLIHTRGMRFTTARKRLQDGFTFIEFLVIIAIIGVMATFLLRWMMPQTEKARDGRRKSDLAKIRTAVENYMDDQGCYPLTLVCGSDVLRPYMQEVPCDPFRETSYGYRAEPNGPGACPTSFAVYTTLENLHDPDIKEVGCGSGCGPAAAYNYGIASGMILENFTAP